MKEILSSCRRRKRATSLRIAGEAKTCAGSVRIEIWDDADEGRGEGEEGDSGERLVRIFCSSVGVNVMGEDKQEEDGEVTFG